MSSFEFNYNPSYVPSFAEVVAALELYRSYESGRASAARLARECRSNNGADRALIHEDKADALFKAMIYLHIQYGKWWNEYKLSL